DPDKAHIFVGVQVSGDEDREQLVADLVAKGYPLQDMTDNEMAKLHIRHMVGGRAPEAVDELVYRFQFPERPGALMNFLNQLGGRWNISMFHYRNHGSAYGRVLAGMQVPAGEKKLVNQFLDDLGYVWAEETDNPAYTFFLS
ncbi:MAG: threonine ammonia-lyase, biosynthetic, partial [Gammaproteobacteria bacterium]